MSIAEFFVAIYALRDIVQGVLSKLCVLIVVYKCSEVDQKKFESTPDF